MATYNPLSTNFKDDILADSNDRRKYTQINNSDGTISLQDSTAYKQVGSQYGAKEVNEEREAINNIYANKLVSLDEIDLVTEEGYFVDAKAVKELNSKMNDCGNRKLFLAFPCNGSGARYSSAYYFRKPGSVKECVINSISIPGLMPISEAAKNAFNAMITNDYLYFYINDGDNAGIVNTLKGNTLLFEVTLS